jgi:hypothetical protein
MVMFDFFVLFYFIFFFINVGLLIFIKIKSLLDNEVSVD